MKENKREQRKIILKFVLILIVSMLLGAASSFGLGVLDGSGMLLELGSVWQVMGTAVPYVFLFANLIAAIVASTLTARGKKEIDAWDGEDESIEDTERKLSLSLLLANTMMVLNFLLFSASLEAASHVAQERLEFRLLMGSLAIFILSYVWIFCVTGHVIKLEKRVNPEKKGNIFDTKFQKQWIASCDEAEKQMIYQCGFRAYRTGNTVCMLLWVVALLTQLWLGTGVFPVACICVIWMAMMLSYQITGFRLEHHK